MIGGSNGLIEKNNDYMLMVYTNTDISTDEMFHKWWTKFTDLTCISGLTAPIRLFENPDQREGMYPEHKYLVACGFSGNFTKMSEAVKSHVCDDDTVIWFYEAIYNMIEKNPKTPGAEEHIFMALTNAKPGREFEYNEWYNNHHTKDICKISCYNSGRRFRVIANNGNAPFEYMCFYRFVGSPKSMRSTLLTDIKALGGIQMSDSYEPKDGAWVYSEIGKMSKNALAELELKKERLTKGMDFYEALKLRKSAYVLKKDTTIPESKIIDIVKEITNLTPSSFNSQSSRVVVLLGKEHEDFWKIVLETLRKVAPAEGFAATEQKIAMLATSYGTILYYEDTDIVKSLQETYPLYADNFPGWAEQSSAMLQFEIWTALAIEGMGATIQHYNPIIDKEVAERFNIPSSWKLIGQMPFGALAFMPQTVEHMPVDLKVFVKK